MPEVILFYTGREQYTICPAPPYPHFKEKTMKINIRRQAKNDINFSDTTYISYFAYFSIIFIY